MLGRGTGCKAGEQADAETVFGETDDDRSVGHAMHDIRCESTNGATGALNGIGQRAIDRT